MKFWLRFGLTSLKHDPTNGAFLTNNKCFRALCGEDIAAYPLNGLWPQESANLPVNLTAEDCVAMKDFLLALEPKTQQGYKVWGPFQREKPRDQYSKGKDALASAVDGMVLRARIKEKVEGMLYERRYHPSALQEHTEVSGMFRNAVSCVMERDAIGWQP
jgi:hypothetical protein